MKSKMFAFWSLYPLEFNTDVARERRSTFEKETVMEILPPSHGPGEMERAMECEERVHPLVNEILIAAVASGWTLDEALVAVEEAVKDIRTARPQAG
jgi:hypothetical protein